MNQRYQSASAVLTALRERLTSARTSNPANILETIVTALAESRGYNWTGIYLAVAEHEVLQSASGAAPASVDVAQVNAEIAVPIRLGARTLGLIVAETNRPANNAHQERTLLQQTAKLIAQYFTTDRANSFCARHARRLKPPQVQSNFTNPLNLRVRPCAGPQPESESRDEHSVNPAATENFIRC